MTCIAVVRHEDKVYMAGDRGASDDGTILALEAPKVWKIGPYLIGYAGAMDGEESAITLNQLHLILKIQIDLCRQGLLKN